MSTFQYTFTVMNTWYHLHGQFLKGFLKQRFIKGREPKVNCPAVQMYNIYKKNSWKKYDGNKNLSGFMFQSRTLKYMPYLSKKHVLDCPNGVYLLVNQMLKNADFIIMVCPQTEFNSRKQAYPYLFAHHISIPFNANTNTVRLHKTRYIPKGRVNMGTIEYDWFEFKDDVEMPLVGTENSPIPNAQGDVWHELMLDCLRFPWNASTALTALTASKDSKDTIDETSTDNRIGFKRNVSKARVRRVSRNNKNTDKKFHNKQLERLWSVLKIRNVQIFTITNDHGIYATCFIHDDYPRRHYENPEGFSFEWNKALPPRKQIIEPLLETLQRLEGEWTGEDKSQFIAF
jgi:hypothetical protein